ncbi:class I SAM-dependent methyltransferase [Brevibacillus reuszeri]|uniref:class I SAM-dependent methyltransferase n=1 Tax=Brevibacillus reuszeri TaxID=54915 RepID=UPI0028A0A27C|nr:class I SAM-dependent methyltransferase [Brevibacillus reuszeri]
MENIWNERFRSEEYYYGEEANVFIQQQAFRFEQGQKVIAFAEGEGRNAVYLTKRNLEVTAIDYAESGLPKGILMLEVFSEEQLKYGTGGPPELDMLYDPKKILAWCEGHEVIHFFNGEQERVAGKVHNGLAHVIQLVLRK